MFTIWILTLSEDDFSGRHFMTAFALFRSFSGEALALTSFVDSNISGP